MGERSEPPEGAKSPEEIARELTRDPSSPEFQKEEGITPEIQKAHDAHALDTEEMSLDKLEEIAEKRFVHATPLEAELAELNRNAAKALGYKDPEGPNEDTFDPRNGPAEKPRAFAGWGAMHPPVETSKETPEGEAPREGENRTERVDERVEHERKVAMQHEIAEGMVRYRHAFLEATDRLLLKPRSESVQQRWQELCAENVRNLMAVDGEARSGRWVDPAIIKHTFDTAAESLTRFAEDADKPS